VCEWSILHWKSLSSGMRRLNMVEYYQRFEGTCYPCLQVRRISQEDKVQALVTDWEQRKCE
jgi:hypothetical protein